MIPGINTFETKLRREISINGKTFIKNVLKYHGSFFSKSEDFSIVKTFYGLEYRSEKYSLKVSAAGFYTITYIGDKKPEQLSKGLVCGDSTPHIYSLVKHI